MKRLLVIIIIFLGCKTSFAQMQPPAETQSWKKIYRATATKINDLVNTKLDVRFDFNHCYLYGKAWITVKPHFYPTDSLSLDAKGMQINKIELLAGNKNIALEYQYNGKELNIKLNKTYNRFQNYTIYIDYVSKPNELKEEGSQAISDAKGLYFINPLGKEKNKPTEIWTQGETESNSAWFPTIDKPNQKCTEEIIMTVPSKYVTLSNGLLISQKKNADGTRTDRWVLNKPNAPYLFFMGVGDFAIIKDHYENKEVSYYVEKPYASVARKIFGNTPEMMKFYSTITGVDYVWPKYSQMIGRDYVSGAMENTTATLHQESAQQDARELTDGNEWETTIAHELFHHWFGDLVTCESWSNITVNESFADYSETLWEKYKYGKDAGGEMNSIDKERYLNSPNNYNKNLVRFYYRDKEDVFDNVSYPKGGSILAMLNNYLGDSAFYAGMHLYLSRHQYQSAEAQDLRLAMEEVSGRDLNWFFNEWYYNAGHPVLDIQYGYDSEKKATQVTVKQIQKTHLFQFPVAIDIYSNGIKKRYQVWVKDSIEEFQFPNSVQPDLVNFDGDKIILCQKTENKTLDNYIFQYKNAGLYEDRKEAIQFASENQQDPKAFKFLLETLNDPYYALRIFSMQQISLKDADKIKATEPYLFNIAEKDPSRKVKAVALGKLAMLKDPKLKSLFEKAVYDSSYNVSGNALIGILNLDTAEAIATARKFEKQPSLKMLSFAIIKTLASQDGSLEEAIDFFQKQPAHGYEKISLSMALCYGLEQSNNPDLFKKGVDALSEYRDQLSQRKESPVGLYFNREILGKLQTAKMQANQKQLADYVQSKL